MTDKPKTIQEALAQVQRNVDEATATLLDPSGKKIGSTDYQRIPGSSVAPTPTPSSSSSLLSKAGGALRAVGRVASPIATAASVSDMAGSLATGTETGRSVGKWIGDNVPGAKTAADAMRKAGEAIGVREPSDRFANVPRTITRTPGSPEAKAAATQLKADKKLPSVGASGDVMKPGQGTPTTQSKYSTSRIGNVDVRRGDTVSGIIAKQRKIDPTYNMDKFKADNPHIKDVNKIAAGSRVNINSKKNSTTNESKEREMNTDLMRNILIDIQLKEYAKKLAEENGIDVNEAEGFGSAFAAARKAGKTEFSYGGKSFNTKLASGSRPSTPSAPRTNTPGTQGVATGKSFSAIDKATSAAEKKTPKILAPTTAQAGAARDQNIKGKTGGEVGSYSSDGSVHSLDRPGNVGARPAGAGAAGTVTAPPKPTPAPSPEQSRAAPGTFAARSAAGEMKADAASAGVKKLMKMEETNPLIAAFLQLQEKNPSNMFEAAKKAKKDHDGDRKIESEKDEYFGSRFAAAKKAGKMKEEVEEIDELEKDTLKNYVDKAKKDVYFLHGDPKRSETKIRKQRRAGIKAAKEKLAKDWGEGVEFSEEELEFFASVEETFTPTEPSRVNKDKAGHTDLTDEVTEDKKKVENPSSERDARKHIQVVAGQAAAGREIDFPHNNGKSTKISPDMGRKITAHLNGLKPAERQAKVKAMHDSPEGMKF